MSNEKQSLIINGIEIKPGERKTLMLPTPKLYDCAPLHIPIHILNSKKPGPTLCITAAIHGDEVNGVEIIRRLLKKIKIKRLNGTVIAVPIVNIYGFLNQDRYLPDRRDLNRTFPGKQQGSLSARLANLIMKELVTKVTHIIDLHAGSLHRTNLPQIRTNIHDPYLYDLAKEFNAPVVLHAKERDGSLRQIAYENSIPLLLYEGGESLRFDELAIKTGINGILSVMQFLGMITLKKPPKRINSAFTKTSYWIRAQSSGILRTKKSLGSTVKKGDLLAIIANPTGIEEHKLFSPLYGIIIGKSNFPLVHEGAALFHIACFEELTKVEKEIENLQEAFSDEF